MKGRIQFLILLLAFVCNFTLGRIIHKRYCLTCPEYCSSGPLVIDLPSCEPCLCDPILDPYKMVTNASKCQPVRCDRRCHKVMYKYDVNGCRICSCRKS